LTDTVLEFVPQPTDTPMVDRFVFESPLGILVQIVDRSILAWYMRRFLIRRNEVLKRLAESEEWRKYLQAM
jgi:hypothetical protein